MKILAIEHEIPGTRPGQYEPLLRAEARSAWKLYQAGIIRELYFRQDRSEAVLVLECPDLAAAEQQVAALPLVQGGLITFELIPLRAYPGFDRLFQPED